MCSEKVTVAIWGADVVPFNLLIKRKGKKEKGKIYLTKDIAKGQHFPWRV